jgi:hypothetical protein
MNQRKRVLCYVILLSDSSGAVEAAEAAVAVEAVEAVAVESEAVEAVASEATAYLFLSVMPSVFGLLGTMVFIMPLL